MPPDWKRSADRCAVEADHLHNLPRLLAEYRPQVATLLLGRGASRLRRAGVAGAALATWEPFWRRLQPHVEAIRRTPDFHDPHLGRPRPAVQRRSGLPGPGVRGPRRRADRAGRAQRRRQDDLDAAPGRQRQARLRRPLRPAGHPGQPAAAGARLRARRDDDRRRQVGPGVADRAPARAGRGRPGDGRGRGRGRPPARRTPLRRPARADRAPGRLFDRPPGRGGPLGPRASPSRSSTATGVDVLRRPAVADDAGQAAVAEPRRHAPGRAVEPPRHRHDRVARELPVAPAGGDGRREPRPLLPRQGRHQDLGAARGEDHGLSGQLQPVLAAPRREGQGAGAPGRAPGREGGEAQGLHPQVRGRPARHAGARPREEARAARARAGRDDARHRRAVHGLRRGRPLRRHRRRGPQAVQGVTTSRCSPTSASRSTAGSASASSGPTAPARPR